MLSHLLNSVGGGILQVTGGAIQRVAAIHHLCPLVLGMADDEHACAGRHDKLGGRTHARSAAHVEMGGGFVPCGKAPLGPRREGGHGEQEEAESRHDPPPRGRGA